MSQTKESLRSETSCFWIIKNFIQKPPLWSKITLVFIGVISGGLCVTAILGVLTIGGVHISIFAPLNTTITSFWKGMPYLMAAMGGPGLLIAWPYAIWNIPFYKIIEISGFSKKNARPKRNRSNN